MQWCFEIFLSFELDLNWSSLCNNSSSLPVMTCSPFNFFVFFNKKKKKNVKSFLEIFDMYYCQKSPFAARLSGNLLSIIIN